MERTICEKYFTQYRCNVIQTIHSGGDLNCTANEMDKNHTEPHAVFRLIVK